MKLRAHGQVWIAAGGMAAAVSVGALSAAPSRGGFVLPPLPDVVVSHCFECHDSLSAEADLDLETFEVEPGTPRHIGQTLEAMLEAVEHGEMPPKDAEPLNAAQRQQLVAWLSENLDQLAAAYQDDPGHVVMPRLTRYEFRNVIRDLSGGVVVDAGRYLPNEGGAGEGFANVGEAQGMNAVVLEKYLEAAKGALRQLRVDPHLGFIWGERSLDPVDEPAKARRERVNAIIDWHVAQQQKWGAEHREALNERFGFVHAAYLMQAWRYRHREDPDAGIQAFARLDGFPLSEVALEKWVAILEGEAEAPELEAWAKAWQRLRGPGTLSSTAALRDACVAITQGDEGGASDDGADFAPDYEISFHEAKAEVLEAAERERRWPFRIDLGSAEELFLVVTDAGDGGGGEYGVWREGRFIFQDGSAQPWQEVITVVGANSGREFPWGIDGEGSAVLGAGEIGVRPPGALKFRVPEGAIIFEVELGLDENRTEKASVQALVLKEKPKSQSYVPGRAVFGGKRRDASAKEENRQRDRALRKRNVSEANRTKIGLNAERNVFARWEHSPIELIGGPWPAQDADREEPGFPYHYTVEQVMRNATEADRAELAQHEARLVAILQADQQALVSLARAQGWKEVREGALPPAEVVQAWDETGRAHFEGLAKRLDQRAKIEAKQVEGMLRDFATRAWRRPIPEPELRKLVTLFRQSREQGFSFDSSVKAPLLVVMASPHFLFRHRAAARLIGQELDDYELASRLSFFLWSSVPDERLLEVAGRGHLSEPDVLRQEARRMLADERAASLASDFAGQLWGFADFDHFDGPDQERFETLTPTLRSAMRAEVVTFLDDLFRSDRPLTALLDADYTFANRMLAEHYGLETAEFGADAHVIKRVSVGEQRGGLAGMALFLTKTSLPLRTSPVQRGTWILEQILGKELPNPPADVEPLSEDETNATGENIRQQLERHRAQASCAGCHDKIDPLGVALENYDPIGRWREQARDGSPLATDATSHDGVALSGVPGLRGYLVEQQEVVFDHVNRKLLGYALGRAVGPGDRTLLKEMANRLSANEYRFSVLVEAIVTSPQFRTRRNDG